MEFNNSCSLLCSHSAEVDLASVSKSSLSCQFPWSIVIPHLSWPLNSIEMMDYFLLLESLLPFQIIGFISCTLHFPDFPFPSLPSYSHSFCWLPSFSWISAPFPIFSLRVISSSTMTHQSQIYITNLNFSPEPNSYCFI